MFSQILGFGVSEFHDAPAGSVVARAASLVGPSTPRGFKISFLP